MKFDNQLFILGILLIMVGNSVADLTGVVSYPKNPGSTVLVSVRFDDNNQLTTINKIFSSNQELDSKIYNFNTKRYALGILVDFQYKCQWYDSILTKYFDIDDIMVPTVYDVPMSRTLSLFFSGSWTGENVTRANNILQSDVWQLRILSSDETTSNLYYLLDTCDS